MSGERWVRVDQLLQSALSRPAHEREAFVRAACTDDVSVGDEVLSLLAHADSAARFLEPPPEREPLRPGERLGEYEIRAHLGAGGMGEIYRARDGRLRRDIALKILPPEAADDERRQRFAQEAQAVAALNHPGIVTIHSVEQSGGINFLTMELVEGQSLAALIPPGGYPIDRLLGLAIPLADAVGAAHSRGIVHRDLKPANVMVTSDGRVKVLDFGLAKLMQTSPAGASTTTIAGALTEDGRILGTLAYMSPEQAEGREVDHRSDIFSLGVLLFEMATGQRPFTGESRVALLASIVKDTPGSLLDLKPDFPVALARLVRKCLAKEPARRYQSVLDVRNDLEEIKAESVSAGVPPVGLTPRVRAAPAKWRRAVLLAGVAVAAAIAYVVWTNRAAPVAESVHAAQLTVSPPSSVRVRGQTGVGVPLIAISPDGAWVAFTGSSSDPQRRGLYLRSMAEIEPRHIRDEMDPSPFFSPDSQWLGFWSNGALWKVAVTGGEARRICAVPNHLRGASWGDDRHIVFASGEDGRLYRVSEDAGDAKPLTETGQAPQRYFFPHVLPGSHAAFVTLIPDAVLAVVSLQTGDVIRKWFPGSSSRYVAGGWAVFRRGSALYAAPFDLTRLDFTGEPRRVHEGVAYNAFGSQTSTYEVSTKGDLFYMPPRLRVAEAELVLLNRQGGTEPMLDARQDYGYPALDPAGRRVALHIAKGEDSDLWVFDIASKTLTPLTRGLATGNQIAWSQDGRWILFSSHLQVAPRLYRVKADGGPPVEMTSIAEYGSYKNAYDVVSSIHGNTVMFFRQVGAFTFDLLTMPLDPPALPAKQFLPGGVLSLGRISRDDLLAYQANSGEQGQVVIQSFQTPDRYRLIAADRATGPQWSRDGRTLFYRKAGDIWSRRVLPAAGGGQPQLGEPELAFATSKLDVDAITSYEPAPDGQRLLIVKRPRPPREENQLVYVNNWFESVKQKLRQVR